MVRNEGYRWCLKEHCNLGGVMAGACWPPNSAASTDPGLVPVSDSNSNM